MSSTNLRVEQIGASGTIPLSTANFFFLVTATAAVDLLFQGRGTTYGASQVLAGLTIGRVDPWDRAEIRGAPGTSVTFHYGDAVLREDITAQNSQIATIAGVANIAEAPSSATAPPVRVTRATGGTSTIAANLARKRITICNPPDNVTPGLLYVQTVGAGAGRGIPLDTGLFVEIKTTAAIDVRNDSGVSVDFTQFEET